MGAARPYCAGVLLVTLTLVMQSAGRAGLLLWARTHLVRGVNRLGVVGAAVLVVGFTGLILCLHVSEILLWAIFFVGSVLRPGNPRSIFRREAILRLVVGIFFSPGHGEPWDL